MIKKQFLRRTVRRTLIAREAAKLLYYNQVKEYNQAKENASSFLGIKTIPSNIEVAIELDKLAEEVEGTSRKELIVELRKEALKLMVDLKTFNPRLVGSVWRGTARKGSDIDIIVYTQQPKLVLEVIKNKYNHLKIEYPFKTDKGKTSRFFHIFVGLPTGKEAEIVVRNLEGMNEKYKCDIYDDFIKGLKISQLQKILEKDPLQKFIPKINWKVI